jgi:hypothetical protein
MDIMEVPEVLDWFYSFRLTIMGHPILKKCLQNKICKINATIYGIDICSVLKNDGNEAAAESE